MSVIVIDEAMKAKLLAAGGTAELRDEAGNVLGEFVPRAEPTAADLEEMGITLEEFHRRLAPGRKTYTTAEVLEYLRGLK